MNPIAEADAQALSETEAAFVRTLNADVQVTEAVVWDATRSVNKLTCTAIEQHALNDGRWASWQATLLCANPAHACRCGP